MSILAYEILYFMHAAMKPNPGGQLVPEEMLG